MEPSEAEPPKVSAHSDSDGYTDEVRAVSGEEIAALGETTAEKEPTPETSSNWGDLDIENLNSFGVDWLPEEHQTKVRSLLGALNDRISHYKTGIDNARSRYDSAESDFRDLISRLDGASSEDSIKILSTQIETQNKQIADATSDLIGTTWKAFNIIHPELEKIPDNFRNEFATLLEDKSFYDKFQGDTLLDKMEDAWRFAAFRTGVDLNRLSSSPSATPSAPPPAPAEGVNMQSKRQSVIADGALSSNRPIRNVDNMSWEEIRDRHGYLLDDHLSR